MQKRVSFHSIENNRKRILKFVLMLEFLLNLGFFTGVASSTSVSLNVICTMNTNSTFTKLDIHHAARGSNRRFAAASGCVAGKTSLPANTNTSNVSSFQPSSVTTAEDFPAFIRPSINPLANCNLWGPLCQTGLIEVELSTANSTTQTTVPCSYYLSAQASSVETYNTPMEYLKSFGRSPECASYADAQKHVHAPGAPWWGNPLNLAYPNCSGNRSPFDNYMPPGVYNYKRNFGAMNDDFYCCGLCTLAIPEIRLLYFASTTYECSTQYRANSSTSVSLSNSTTLRKRAHSLLPMGSTFVSDHFTFTSPSFYLEIIGTAAVHDSCGLVGSAYPHAIVAVPSAGLSSVSLDVPIGAKFGMQDFNRDKFSSYTKPVNIRDLVCPTWGLANDNPNFATVGAPFFPILVPPPELYSYDAQWVACTEFRQKAIGGQFLLEIFDPPRVLTPVDGLMPATTPADGVTASDPTPTANGPQNPAPALGRSTELPMITVMPNAPKADPTRPSPAKSHAPESGSAKPGPAEPDPAAPSLMNPDPAHSGSAKTNLAKAEPENPDPANSDPANFDPTNTDSKNPDSDPDPADPDPADPNPTSRVPAEPMPHPPMKNSHDDAGGDQQSSLGLGAIILSAFGNSGPSQARDKFGEKIFSIGGSTFTFSPSLLTTHGSPIPILPSTLKFDDSILSEGGNALTVGGTPVVLRPSGLFIGNQPTSMLIAHNLAPAPTSSPLWLMADGQKITVLDRSRIAVAGSTLVANVNPVTLSRAVLSLGPDGRLIVASPSGVGGSDQKRFSTPSPLVYTVGGDVFTANPKGFTISGTSVLPGGRAIIVSGVPMSLDSSGRFYLGGIVTDDPSFSGLRSTRTRLDGGIVIALPTLPPFVAFSTLHMGSHLFTMYHFSIVADGRTLRPNGPAITLSGKAFSLDSSGHVTIGASSSPAQGSSIFVVNGATLTGDGAGLMVGGTTLRANDAGIIISGTPISLGPSGDLQVGHSTVTLSLSSSARGGDPNGIATGSVVAFTGHQSRVQWPVAWSLTGILFGFHIILFEF